MKKNLTYFLIAISFFVFEYGLRANQINVPIDYPTIQEAIDNAVSGDTIIIQNGVYAENIDFKGKEIVVGSLYLVNNQKNYVDSVTIDGQNLETVVKFITSETGNSKLIGLTLINGYAGEGGGIKCNNTNPTIENVKIKNCNAVDWGGGLFVSGGEPLIKNITLSSNANGAVMIRDGANPLIYDMKIDNNTGDAIFFYGANAIINNLTVSNNYNFIHSCFGFNGSSPTINNALIINNDGENLLSLTNSCDVLINFATFYGNNINTLINTTETSSKINIKNSIVWANIYSSINEYPNTITIENSNFEGGYAGVNIISEEPKFFNPDSLNFSLLYSSSCIGIGDTIGVPQYDIENSPRPYPASTNPDLGAFENILGSPIDEIYIYDTINVYDTTLVHVFDTIPVYDSIIITINDTITIFDTTLVEIYDTISVTDTLFIDVSFSIIQNPNNEMIKVYPNPTNEVLFIDFGSLFSELPDYQVRIINSAGTVIYSSDINQSSIEINLQDFGDTGLYYLQIIKNPNQIMDVKKLILE